MFDLKKSIANSKEQKEAEKPTLKFNFKPSNSLSDSSSTHVTGNQTPGAQTAVGKTAFSFKQSDDLSSDDVETDAAGDVGSSVAPASTTPPSPEDIGKMNIDDFVFPQQKEEYSGDAIEKLKGSIDILYQCIDDKEMVGQAVTIIMKTLKEHPFLKDNLRPEDCQMMVRGLRKSYGTVIAKKSANKNKRRASEKRVDETVGLLKDLGLGDMI